MRFLQISVIVLFLLMQGCGSKSSPVAPHSDYSGTQTILTDSQRTVSTNRYLWGIWDVRILGDRETVEIIPDRSSTMHFNTVRLMEEVPCTTCIAIFIKQFIPPDILSVDFRLAHPFPAPLNLTAFDLRGIIINGADYTFPASNRSVGMGNNKLVLLNPDGYTSLFNPTEFSEDSGMPPVLRYYPGKLELDGDLSSTLNPYIAYSQDLPRRVFYVASEETRNVQVRLPDVPVEFGYAVDVSWIPVEIVDNPIQDFPPEANCVEAYKIDLPDYIQVSAGEMSEVVVEIFDHQGIETISSVTVEAPEIFSGEIPFDFVESTGVESCTYSGEITNELNAVPGNYPILFRVTDKFLDNNHGQVDAWQIEEVNVLEPPKEDPVAIAMADPLSVYTGDPVHFFDDGSYDPDGGAIVLFEWDWENDGEYDDTGDDAYYVWQDPGTYEVQFRVTDDEGAMDELDEPIVIEVIDETEGGWARTWGGTGNDQGFAVAADGSENLYVTGYFTGTVDFDPEGGDPHTSSNYTDVYLSKFDSSGNFEWARTWGGSGVDAGYGVATEGSGNVYVTGLFEGTVDFDPGGGDPHTSSGGPDVFLSKFDSSGNFEWAWTWGGPGWDEGLGVAGDSSGNVYVTGYFNGTVDFNPGGGDPHTSNGVQDIFLSKFDSLGHFEGARTWGGSGDDYGHGVAVDDMNDIYVAGSFEGTVDFDPDVGTDSHSSLGGKDIFLSKFNSAGTHQWAQTWGASGDDGGYNLAVAGNGDAYVTGQFQATVDFDPGPGSDYHSVNGYYDVYLSKFDSSGVFQWANTWGASSSDGGRWISVGSLGDVNISGWFTGTVDFDPGEGVVSHSAVGDRDAFLSRFDSSGDFHWARTWGGSDRDSGNGVAAGSGGTVYVTGSFINTVNFAPSGPPCGEAPDVHVSGGLNDAYLTKYLPDGCW